MDEKQQFILSCFSHQQVVRFTTLYHFLKGKKTSSILTFGFFNSLLPYFNLLPELSLNEYNCMIETLMKKKYLELVGEMPFVKVTSKGLENLSSSPFTYLNGFDYYRYADDFWRMLQFLTQVISEKQYKNSRYVPIEGDLFYQYQLKRWIATQSNDWSKEVMTEWLEILNDLGEEASLLLTEQLMGHQLTGLTKRQLSTKYNLDLFLCEIKLKEALHKLLTIVIQNKKKYASFYNLLEFSKKIQPEDTVLITQALFKKGLTISEIAKQRQLKESTVTDHLIEVLISLPTQELTKLVAYFKLSEVAQRLTQQYPKIRDWHFSEIKKQVDLDFFQFRLLQFWLVKGVQGG